MTTMMAKSLFRYFAPRKINVSIIRVLSRLSIYTSQVEHLKHFFEVCIIILTEFII